MPFKQYFFTTFYCIALLIGCANNTLDNPGELAGKWRLDGLISIPMEFKQGEVTALDITEKVTYEAKGRDILVTYKTGVAKGTVVKYTITGDDSAVTELGTLKRVQ
ncbi:hypothetical protein Meth11DRAFT_0452 [Methylophilaceae bacterium 11]|uniref:hypothetical protein n=1 Tax=unclassified Methylotenera TaxID=2643294 RepID=UPI000376DF3E|nr:MULTISPECIES: hypothetical protein [unclassified Methylotenera]EUJ09653.1 hypothetical protein Meth11DRAFT_0452 [Methylophilaceae bacterium 11]